MKVSKRIRVEGLSEQEKRTLLILETIRRKGGMSLAGIAKHTGLNLPTVSNYLQNLLKKKIILEKGEVFTGGRPATLLQLNPQRAYILGIGVNLKSVVAVVIDFKGRVLQQGKEEIKEVDIRKILISAFRLAKELIKKAKIKQKDISGVGIGIGGIVDYENGLIHWPSRIGPAYLSVYLSLEELIKNEFNPSTIVVENDATAAAFAEWWLYFPAVKNAIYIYSGVGCGIIANGELYRGATGSAGELSIYNPEKNSLLSTQPTVEDNPFYRWNLDFGIIERAKEALKKGKRSQILKLAKKKIENVNLRIIIQAAEENDALAKELIRRTGRSLGVRLAYLINLLDPELVIIGGGIEKAGEFLLSSIKETVRKWSFNHSLKKVKIVPAHLGEEVIAIGASNLALRQMFISA
ncbi:MAG: hypothetical protein DRP75_02555 [Candidatus Omnitrophota bacterium]|nr:MAG: hypothetical protein DRP75_02555 [Candidatus Omnitrophota bacterium]